MTLFFDDYLYNSKRFRRLIDKGEPNWRLWAGERLEFHMEIEAPDGTIY